MIAPLKFIAELSGNHNGSLERLLELTEAATRTGATHIKLQTYTADSITLPISKPPFVLPDDHPLWPGRDLYSLYTEAATPWEWHKPVFDLIRDKGLVPFSTPFDQAAVEFLESLDVELYKVASLEIGDIPLLREIGRTGKPVIISTGAATLDEVDLAITTLKDTGSGPITALVCTSSYPANPVEANLLRIKTLQDEFAIEVGLSDHTLGVGVPVAAVALGATTIEKHVTLSRDDGGVDSGFSSTAEEFQLMVKSCSDAYVALGSPEFRPSESEETSISLKRSIFVSQNVAAGEAISLTNVAVIRPAGGLAPVELDQIIGLTFTQNVDAGTPLTWDLINMGSSGGNSS